MNAGRRARHPSRMTGGEWTDVRELERAVEPVTGVVVERDTDVRKVRVRPSRVAHESTVRAGGWASTRISDLAR
jgi:hypothetical protein